MKREQRNNTFKLRPINKVRSQTPYGPLVTHIQNDMAILESNRAMVNVSTRLSEDLVVCRLIGNTRVSMTRRGYAKNTNERHHLVTLELLARKWGIGLEKAKEVLHEKTQDCISLALIPLTRRYRIDLISQLLRRLSTTFYTEVLFAKQKYIIGNTSAKITTDREGFVYFHTLSHDM